MYPPHHPLLSWSFTTNVLSRSNCIQAMFLCQVLKASLRHNRPCLLQCDVSPPLHLNAQAGQSIDQSLVRDKCHVGQYVCYAAATEAPVRAGLGLSTLHSTTALWLAVCYNRYSCVESLSPGSCQSFVLVVWELDRCDSSSFDGVLTPLLATMPHSRWHDIHVFPMQVFMQFWAAEGPE